MSSYTHSQSCLNTAPLQMWAGTSQELLHANINPLAFTASPEDSLLTWNIFILLLHSKSNITFKTHHPNSIPFFFCLVLTSSQGHSINQIILFSTYQYTISSFSKWSIPWGLHSSFIFKYSTHYRKMSSICLLVSSLS